MQRGLGLQELTPRAARRARRALGLALGLLVAPGCGGAASQGPAPTLDPCNTKGGNQCYKAMPTGRAELAVVAGADGKIYAIGGYNFGSVLGAVEVYDPAANTWTGGPAMPTPRRDFGAVLGPDKKIYTIGGQGSDDSAVATVEALDPMAGRWSSAAAMPTARTQLAAVTGPDGLIYAIGGETTELGYLTTVEAFDPGKGTWSAKASLSTPRGGLAAVAGSDGKIYAIGGDDSAAGPPGPPAMPNAGWQAPGTMEYYAPAMGQWTTGTPMNTPIWGYAAVDGGDGNLYVIGGANEMNSQTVMEPISSVETYSYKNGYWTSAPGMPTPRALFGATVVNGKIYAVGGEYVDTKQASYVLTTNEAYSVSAGTW